MFIFFEGLRLKACLGLAGLMGFITLLAICVVGASWSFFDWIIGNNPKDEVQHLPNHHPDLHE
jgi:hypothetical protein